MLSFMSTKIKTDKGYLPGDAFSAAIPVLEALPVWDTDPIHDALIDLAAKLG